MSIQRLRGYDGNIRAGRRSGSALIITMLLLSVVASISFAVTALTISEFRKTAALQDSIGAYYAAEAGIEHGLLQYRLWHEAEISELIQGKVARKQTVTADDSPTEEQDGLGQPQSYRLDGNGSLRSASMILENSQRG